MVSTTIDDTCSTKNPNYILFYAIVLNLHSSWLQLNYRTEKAFKVVSKYLFEMYLIYLTKSLNSSSDLIAYGNRSILLLYL